MSLLTNVLKLWRTGQYLLPADSGFMVKHLFANGEPGFAKLDFSGFAGMYQDRARTIPYTAVEQPLGSFTGLNGVTATAPADVNRGVVSARVNLHTASELPAGTADTPTSGGNLTAGSIAGYQGAIAFGVGTDTYAYKSNFTVLAGIEYIFSVVVQMTDGLAPNFAADHTPENDFGLIIGTNAAGVIDPSTYSVVNLGSGTYRVSGSRVVNANSPNVGILKRHTSSNRTFKVTAYDLRLHIDARLPYQRVNTATDYDTAGFPHYLAFNGTNTAYATPSIDFSGTDKMTVWAGVTKLSDALAGVVLELSSIYTAPGAFLLSTPIIIGDNFGLGLAGSYVIAPGYPRPWSSVLSGSLDIAGAARSDEINLRINSLTPAVVGAGNANAGTGNFQNSPLYIGARAGTSLFLNGKIYSLIVRGAATPLPQIEVVETLIRQKMRLP